MSILRESVPLNILIVGGGGGIGLGFVKQFLEPTFSVNQIYATYRTPESASELIALSQQNPARLTALAMDITQESAIASAVEQISSQTKAIHLVIYCVGILHRDKDFQPEKSLRQIDSDNLLQYFQINSIGAVLLAKHLMPLFKHQDSSIFAAISAKVGSIGDNRLGGWYGYRASKAALNMFLKTISIEYSRRCPKTIVTALHPGTTDTKLSEPFQANVPQGKLFPVSKTVGLLTEVMKNLEQKDSGEFFSWDGSRLPW